MASHTTTSVKIAVVKRKLPKLTTTGEVSEKNRKREREGERKWR